MLSNSNVCTLLILIEYVTLFDYTLANSVLVNARTANQTVYMPNDAKITNNTLEATATTLSSTSSIRVDDQQKNFRTIYRSTDFHFSTLPPTTTTATIKSNTPTEFTEKNPIVPENHKLFEKNGQSIVATSTIDITSSSSLSLSSSSSIETIQSTIDQTINSDEILLFHDNNRKNVHNTNVKKNGQQTPTQDKMVSSTLASNEKLSHYVVDTLSKSKITISNDKNGKNNDADDDDGEMNANATNRSLLNENDTNNKSTSSIQFENNKETNNHKMQNINSIEHDNDYYHREIVQADAPITNYETKNELAEPTIRSDAVYFVVAVNGGAKIWSRTLLRTLSDMGPPFSGDPLGSPLVPIFIDLPTNGRFSLNVLLSLCQQTEKRPLAGVVVIGNSHSAHAVALSGTSMSLPVLWAKGGTTALRELHPEAPLETLLQPSAIEIFEAIRALFLQTHWHSFFVLSNAQATNVMNAKDNPLKKAPLTPTVVPLPRNNDDVFKQLAQISRSTRGVILLLCNLQSTRRIMSEAQRLNMVGGHFIWLWIDTSISSVYFDPASSPSPQPPIYRHQTSAQSQPKPTRKSSNGNTETEWKNEESVEHQRGGMQTLDKSARFNEKDDINSESIHFEGEKFVPSEISSQAKVIDIDNHKSDLLSTKLNGDFSHGFDPFRALQRQDDHLKTSFGLGAHYQDRNIARDKPVSANRLILGLRSENSPTPPTDGHIQHIENKKNRRHTADAHIDDTDDKYFDSNEMMTDDLGKIDLNLNANANENLNQDSNEDDELVKFYNFDQIASKKFNRTNSTTKQHFSDDNFFDYLIENDNLNENRNSKINFKRTSMTSNGNHMNTSSSTSSSSSSSSFVNYHQFKDFPIGLLALRPIRMNVDRHFIRATIRVFAATWRKINIESKLNQTDRTNSNASIEWPMSSITRSQQSLRGQQDKARDRNAHISAPIFTAKKLDTELYQRIMRRKRNISTVNRLLLVTLNKRSIKSLNDTGELNSERNIFDADLVENKQTVPTHSMQVNSSSVLKRKGFNRKHSAIKNYNNNNNFNNNNNYNNNNNNKNNNNNNNTNDTNNNNSNDNNKNIKNYMNNGNENNDESMKLDNFSSDLPNKIKNYNKNSSNYSGSSIFSSNSTSSNNVVNISINQNFSGLLWKQNSNIKSNIQLFNITPIQIIKKNQLNNESDQTEKMAKEASQTILTNWFNTEHLDDVRMPSNKRQSKTTKKEIPSPNVQNKRPAVDASVHQDEIHQNSHHINSQLLKKTPHYSGGCYGNANEHDIRNAEYFARALRNNAKMALSGKPIYNGFSESALTTNFELFNLVPSDHPFPSKASVHQQTHRQKRGTRNTKSTNNENGPTKWRRVGLVSASSVRLDTIVWPGGDIVVSGLSARARSVFRIVTALAPPFVMESELDEDGLCLRGLSCHELSPVGRHNLTLMFNAIETRDRLEEDAVEHGNNLPPEPEYLDEKISHVTKCCYGLTMDLLDNIAMELGFEFHLYIVRDQLFGAKQQRDIKEFLKYDNRPHQQKTADKTGANRNVNKAKAATENEQWNGIIGDLTGGLADMSFAPLSVSKARAQVIDFSVPYFHSGVSLLASPKTKSEIPLLAFLLPFSPELWIAIFTSLNITAVAVAVYEWLSPFGLNPWGRQRSKNFSLSSALWVMWGLLCGHLVAFKAPKSWPNKFLINVWGGFSVIFVASYTANIAALIAGLFFHHAASSYDSSLATQRVGAPKASAAESYVQNKDRHLWEHMKKYSINHIEDGIRGLKNGTLDLLMADSPILDYYRATDHGCSLQRIGETFVEDTYAIGMVKGFPLKESISALIAKYSSNGYLDILTEKWYGGLPCFKYEAEIVTPRPLGVAAVAGVFLLLGMGMLMGVIILIFEHWFYKYALPSLRLKPKGTIWKSRNIMFFSQKLYRFINCVELVSPHHAARELVHSIRQGQIASLFQKSIKRKEDEQRRRRKSKAQFFEMIQEIRRAQQVERQNLAAVAEAESQKEHLKSPPSIFKPKSSPKTGIFSALKKDGRSRSNSSVLTVRRYSTDSILGDRMDSIGRRLSRDLTNSPPDLGRRYESYGNNDNSPNRYETITGGKFSSIGISKSNETLTNRYDTFTGKNSEIANIPVKANKNKNTGGKRPKISFESYDRDELTDLQLEQKKDFDYELPSVKEGLEPAFLQDDRSTAILRHRLHQEIRDKYLTIPDTSNNVSASVKLANAIEIKPPIPKKFIKHQRQKSLDNLDADESASNQSKTSPSLIQCETGSLTKMNEQTSQMSLERLSREDLLRLSHSSQSEIHEYLKKSTMPDTSAEPP